MNVETLQITINGVTFYVVGLSMCADINCIEVVYTKDKNRVKQAMFEYEVNPHHVPEGCKDVLCENLDDVVCSILYQESELTDNAC